jgi:hypothetical protein
MNFPHYAVVENPLSVSNLVGKICLEAFAVEKLSPLQEFLLKTSLTVVLNGKVFASKRHDKL